MRLSIPAIVRRASPMQTRVTLVDRIPQTKKRGPHSERPADQRWRTIKDAVSGVLCPRTTAGESDQQQATRHQRERGGLGNEQLPSDLASREHLRMHVEVRLAGQHPGEECGLGACHRHAVCRDEGRIVGGGVRHIEDVIIRAGRHTDRKSRKACPTPASKNRATQTIQIVIYKRGKRQLVVVGLLGGGVRRTRRNAGVRERARCIGSGPT
jgi:hypothetical protein